MSSGYVYIAGSANNAYFGNGTNLTVAADVVAGGIGVIRANDTTVYDIGSILEANTTLTASAWDNNQSTVTAKVNGTSVGTLTVSATEIYNAGWNAALDACTGHTCYTGNIKQLYDDSLDVYVNAISPYQERYYYELPARKS